MSSEPPGAGSESEFRINRASLELVRRSSGWMLAAHRGLDLPGRHLLLGGGGRDVDIGVVIDLVALPQVLDDVKVGPGCFCQAVLQNPTIRL